MERARELLLVKAELLLWQCQKEMYAGKVMELRKQYIIEQDEAERAERSFFAKLRRNYEENLGKEKAEIIKVRLELERIEKIIAEAEEKIPFLERKMENDSFLYNIEDFTEEEKELRDWCQWMEEAYAVIALANRCIEVGEKELIYVYSDNGNREKRIMFQSDIAKLYEEAERFLSKVGKVRYLAGTKVKTAYGERRTTVHGGKGLVFIRPGYAKVEIDLHDFDFGELAGSLAVGDALERKVKEIAVVRAICISIMQEQMSFGENLIRELQEKDQNCQKRDVWSFEIQK